jgi:hypothetical protein
MEFVNPRFLYGLFAVSIPVIIHLFNFRRFKKIYFTNVSFIRELKLQTQKQSRLKHLLILIMRILAIAALVLAFAQPYLPVSENIIQPLEKNAVSIYIDNSFSMEAVSKKGIMLDEAKEKAREIASVYNSSDLFQLLTNDFEGRHQRFVTREEFLELVDEIQISPVVKTLPEVFSRQQVLFSGNSATVKTAYAISDFQKQILEGDLSSVDSTLNAFLIPVEAINKDNLYIDSCWFETPVYQVNQNVKLNVRIRNSSEKNFEKIPLKLKINGQQKALASFDIQANEPAEVILSYTNYTTGIQFAELEISDYTINFDDKLWFSYMVSSFTSILCINGTSENIYLNSLFKKDSLFLFKNVNEGNIDYSDFASYQLIILNELNDVSSGIIQGLLQFVSDGGSLMVLPSEKASRESYDELMKSLNTGSYGLLDTTNTKVSYINLQHPVYTNVFDEIPENLDLPVVFQHFPIRVGVRSRQESLLELQQGGPFLNVYQVEKGKVYLFAVPFQTSFSNFPKHAIFVPTLYKIAISSVTGENLFFTIGNNDVINIRNIDLGNEQVLRIKDRDSDFEFIPEHRRMNSSIDLFPHGQVSKAGNYTLVNGEIPFRGIAFNYDRTESEMIFYTPDAIKNLMEENGIKNIQVLSSSGKPFIQTLTELSMGIRLWRWFILFALGFLLAEVLLLRFMK